MKPRRHLSIAVAVAMLAAGCDSSLVPPTDEPTIREIILAGDDGTHTFSHTDHWHGAPVVRLGEAAGFTIHFSRIAMPVDEHDPPPTDTWFTLEAYPAYNVHVVIEDTTLARWSGDRVRGTLEGLRAGASRISFVVRRGTTTIHEAPPLNFRVQDPDAAGR